MRNLTTWLIVAALAILLMMGSVFVVNESQTAIVLNLGKIVRSNLQPGLHFKLPMVEEVRKFDRRILSLDDAPERYLSSDDLMVGPRSVVLTLGSLKDRQS